MLFLSSVNSVPTAARFCNPSNTPVTRPASSPLLRLRLWNNLLPTLSVTYSGGVSSFHASTICRNSSSSLSQSESAQERTSPFSFEAAIDWLVQILNFDTTVKPLRPWHKEEVKGSAQERTSPFRLDAAIDSLVQIFHFDTTPKPLQPWEESTEGKGRSGSGFIISGRRILADTFIVSDHSSLRVRKFGSPTVYTAKVEAVVHKCGLATLVVDCEEFWENTHALELDDDLPSIGEPISVLTYDYDTIKLTEGAVSSVEPRDYYNGTSDSFSIKIDTDICYTYGPVFLRNRVVGLYLGCLCDYDIIPTSVIKYFLSGIEGRYTGYCPMAVSYQTMEDAQLRKHFKMSHDMKGVLITDIVPLSNAFKVLKVHDVILAIDGFPVDNDGLVHFQKKEWPSLNNFVFTKKPGETALVRVLRDGKEHAFNVSLNFTNHELVPYDFLPSYYIVAGFVFVPLSEPYIQEESCDICKCALKRVAKKAGEQIVILSQVLSDDINQKYTDFKDFEVKKVNGVEVVNLKHLSELVEKCGTEHLRFDLEEGYVIVLNNKSAKEATSLILERNGIPSAMSSDLQ